MSDITTPSPEIRQLLLFCVLSLGVLWLWGQWFRSARKPTPQQHQAQASHHKTKAQRPGKIAVVKPKTDASSNALAFLYQPIRGLLRWVHRQLGRVGLHNWGLSIIVLTLLMKLLLLPLTHKGHQASIKMQALQPALATIKEKHKDDPIAMQQASLAAMREHGVGITGGCLPMLLQMPIWLGMYQAILHEPGLKQAPLIAGWISDLSVPDPWFLLPLLVGALMLLQQRLTPTPSTAPGQRLIIVIMLAGTAVIMAFLPSALALYSATSAAIGLLQYIVFQGISQSKKTIPTGPNAKKTELLAS